MCQYLDPAIFMATVFTARPDRTAIDFVSLRKVRDHVTEKLAGQNVVIEWTRDAVMGALEAYPDLFENHDREVTWLGSRDGDTSKQNLDSGFSDGFLGDLRGAILEVSF